LKIINPKSTDDGKYTILRLKMRENGFNPNIIVSHAIPENTNMIIVAAPHESVSSLSTGSKF